MQRKANSKPMKAIMQKILEFYQDWLSFIIFPEDVIMNEPVEKWPLCDCLVSFHATDFPLYKAIEYERLRRPYVINDLHRQYDLLDRRKVFRALARAGIAHPRHCVLIRDAQGNGKWIHIKVSESQIGFGVSTRIGGSRNSNPCFGIPERSKNRIFFGN